MSSPSFDYTKRERDPAAQRPKSAWQSLEVASLLLLLLDMSSDLLPELWNMIFLLFKAPHLLRSAALVCRLWHTRSWKALCSSGIRLSTRHLASALSRLQAIGFIHQIQHLTLEIPPGHDLQLDLGFLASFLSLRSLEIDIKHGYLISWRAWEDCRPAPLSESSPFLAFA